MKAKKSPSHPAPAPMMGPIPREELERAMMKDFEQRCIDAMTPDRGYGFPMDNVEAVIAKYWPNMKGKT